MKRVVVKIGSSSLVTKQGDINRAQIVDLIKEIALFKANNIYPLIVTSGAVAVGANKLGIKPKTISMKQACAAVGQASLMHDYDMIFEMYGLKCAQILLNHDDFANRNRMLNLENTINSLIENDVVPIINENDALAVEEIKVGDNDTLSALISSTIGADLLVLISDIDGLYDDNPATNKDAKLISIVDKIDEEIEKMAGGVSSNVGTGGMQTKIKAAKIATSSGVNMVIMNNKQMSLLHTIFDNQVGTLFKAQTKMAKKMQWLAFVANSSGSIIVDKGASEAVISRKSLLPKGITNVNGTFEKEAIVDIIYNGNVIAKGIVNYCSEEIIRLKGHDSKDVNEILGHVGKNVVIHANSMVVLEASVC